MQRAPKVHIVLKIEKLEDSLSQQFETSKANKQVEIFLHLQLER